MTNVKSRPAYVVGAAMTKFGDHVEQSLAGLASDACVGALDAASLEDWPRDWPVFFANAAAGIITGQAMITGETCLKRSPVAGAPMVNVENACASGGTAVWLAANAVAHGQAGGALAVGAEKLRHEDKSRSHQAIRSGTDLSMKQPQSPDSAIMMGSYAALANEYLDRSGCAVDILADVAVKNRMNANTNPNAHYRDPLTRQDVLEARVVEAPLTLPMCSPLSDGAAAVVIRSKNSSAQEEGWVRIEASNLASYVPNAPESVVARAAKAALASASIVIDDVDLIELHDASAIAEVLQYEEIGLASAYEGFLLLEEGKTGRRGDTPVNLSGGLLSRGHPLAATGCAQIFELSNRLAPGRGSWGGGTDGHRVGLAINAGGWMGDDYAAAVATILSDG